MKTKAPVERDALIIVMGFCFKFKIGYEREGLRVLFDLYVYVYVQYKGYCMFRCLDVKGYGYSSFLCCHIPH